MDINNLKIRIKNTAWHYLFLFTMILTWGLLVYLTQQIESNIKTIAVTAISVFYGIYILILQLNFSKQYPQFKKIINQIEANRLLELSGELTPEENDEEIVNLEVKLKAENERMNAYVIEAALFGALAFSGYLGLVTSQSLSFSSFEIFNNHLLNLLGSFLGSAFENVAASRDFLFSKNGILVLLSHESVFCSVFFLAVIASRLYFRHITDYIDRFLQLAKAMNIKEESLLINDKTNTDKIKFFNHKIKDYLRDGYKKYAEIIPVMEYMKFFRTLGIVMFFIIIVTGGLFISPVVSFILFFISGLSMSYFYLGGLKDHIKSFYISMQEFYFRADKTIQIVSWSIIFIAILLRTFFIPGGGVLVTLGFAFLFIHYLMNLFIPVQFDYEIKNQNDIFGANLRFNKILVYALKISLSLFFAGYLFKTMHWPFANILLTISLFTMSAYFLVVRKFKKRTGFWEYVLGFFISFILVAILFKILHFPGAGFFIVPGLVLTILSVVLVYWKRKEVRASVKRTVIILSIIPLSFVVKPLESVLRNFSLNYKFYEKQLITSEIIYSFYGNHKLVSEEQIGADSLQILIDNVNNNLEDICIYNIDNLNSIAWDIYIYSEDSILIKNGLIWSEKTIETENWMYMDTYASLLYKNKQYEKAKHFAKKANDKWKNSNSQRIINQVDSVLNMQKGIEQMNDSLIKKSSEELLIR